MDYPVCLNPSCKSYGKSHPNCRCYAHMAKGGDIENFCSSNREHAQSCFYFADGGGIDFTPDPEPVPATSSPTSTDGIDFTPDNQDAALQDKYGSPGQQGIAALEGAAKGLAGPAATAAEKALGVPGEDVEGRAAANPVTHYTSEAAGLIGPALLTGGASELSQAGVLGQAGADAAKLVGAEGAVGTAVKMGVENALFTLGDEVSKAINGSPDSIQTAAVHTGLSGLLGAGVGYPLGKASELWMSKFGNTAEEFTKDFTDRLKQASTDLEATSKPLVRPEGEVPQNPSESIFGGSKATPEGRARAIEMGTARPENDINLPHFTPAPAETVEEGPSPLKGSKAADFITNKAEEYATKAVATGLGSALGHLTGIPMGGTLGGMLGNKLLKPFLSTIMPTLIKPLLENPASALGLRAAVEGIQAIAKGQSLIGKAAEGVFETGSNAVLQNAIPDDKTLHKLDLHVQEAQMAPNMMSTIGGDLGHYLPQHQTALAAMAQNAVNYLSSQKPRGMKLGILDREIPPSPAQESAYNRTLAIAQQPLSVLNYLKQGTLKQKDVQDLKAIYPALHQQLVQKVHNAMVDHLSKQNPIPYKLRGSLSKFMEQPLDSTMMPMSIMAAQATFMPPPAPQKGKPGPKTNTAKLGKTAKLAQTPEASRIEALSKA